MPKKSPTRAMKKVNKAMKITLVKEILLAGVTSQGEIRKALATQDIFITKGTVSKYVHEILDEWADAVSPEEKERWRGKELAKCDKLEQKLHKKCLEGNISAVNAVLKIMKHRADLLGLVDTTTINNIIMPSVIVERMENEDIKPVPVIAIDADYEEIEPDELE